MGYIYKLTSPSGKSYIGQTIRPIEKRLEEHRTGESKRCRAIYNAIKEYGWENFEKEWNEVPDDDLNFYEEMLVALLGTLSPCGYNLREGGGNGKMSEETKKKISVAQIGKTHTEESKRKHSESIKGDKHHNYGKTLSEEHKQKLSEAHLGKTLSDENKRKISEAMKGEKNHRSKRVYQYDLEGNLLSSSETVREAARHLKTNDGSKIRSCARGERKTAYGFKWSYTYLCET